MSARAARRRRPPPEAQTVTPQGVRISGGRFRGRRLAYSGNRRVRPMKARVRETLFNILGGDLSGHRALDLFAGTGALGLEALSRGATWATFVERHRPTADCLRKNVATLGVEDCCQVVVADVFRWWRQAASLTAVPHTVFCCPPYELFHTRRDDMLQLIASLLATLPPESTLVVESDVKFPAAALPDPDRWDVRAYPPAQLLFCDIPAPNADK